MRVNAVSNAIRAFSQRANAPQRMTLVTAVPSASPVLVAAEGCSCAVELGDADGECSGHPPGARAPAYDAHVFVLPDLDVDDLIECSRVLQAECHPARTMTSAAAAAAACLHRSLVDEDGQRATALVRIYKTHRYSALPPDARAFAERTAGDDLDPVTSCLTLIGTSGTVPEWNDPTRSASHRAIPLADHEAVARLPMVAGLLRELGVGADLVVTPGSAVRLRKHHETYNVFHVLDARGSALIPAQDFVDEHGVRSVVGCGGILLSGDFYGLIIFATVTVPPAQADLFRSIALTLKAALAPHTFRVFDEPQAG
jgi:two-component system NtrC family sensor kinase